MCAMEFYAVETCFYGSGRCLSIALYNLVDLIDRHSRKRDLGAYRHITGHKDLCSLVKPHCKASLPKLDACFSTCLVDGVNQPLQTRNIFVF